MGSLAQVFAQSTAGGLAIPPNYDTFQPPVAGGTYVDPVFGSTIQRVSNALNTPDTADGGNLTWIENEYATMSAFNSDNSRFILLHQSYFGLYNGASGVYMNDLPFEISASSEPRWSRRDNVTIYYHSGNQLKSYNISTGGIGVVHTFSEYSSISGNGEMDISLDGDHFVFVGDNKFVFVYQISTDTKYTAFDAGSRSFDSVYITPNNNVILSWYPSGTARYTGQELFDIDMNFLRQVGHADGHKDVTSDANGDEVLIWTNSDDPNPIANCNNGIVKIRLADASQTCLLQLDWSLAVHISAPDGNGTVFVDTEAPANPEPGSSAWVPYANELLQVKLDGSGATRWAHHRSRTANSYNWEPKLSTSRDGTRLLFASNYDLSKIDGYNTQYSDTYQITLPATSASPSPLPVPPTPITTTPPVIVTTSPLPSGTAGVSYPQTLAASGGVAPYTWALASGTLPAGLTLASGGAITGAPASAGISTFSIQVADSASATATQSFSLTVAPASAPVPVPVTVPVPVPVTVPVSQYAVAGSMAQVASGGSWTTTITLVNSGPAAADLQLNFYDDNGAPLTLPLTFPQTPSATPVVAATLSRTLGAGSGLVVVITGPASQAVQEGWAQLLTDGSVSGFADFACTASGGVQEAVAPLQGAIAGSWVLWFDNTAGYATGVALANVSSQTAAVPVIVRDDTGAVLAAGPITLAALAHGSFMVTTQYPQTAQKRGSIEFQTPAGGQIGVLGLRSSESGALTTVPPIAR